MLAVWPAPHDADECLRLAGFTDFADTDDAWDVEWRGIVERAVEQLAVHGAPRMRKRVEVEEVQARSILERLLRAKPPGRSLNLSMVEQLILLTEDDQFPDAVVEFGEACSVSLRTRGGHAVLWVATGSDVCLERDEFLKGLAEDRPIEQTDLDWNYLVG